MRRFDLVARQYIEHLGQKFGLVFEELECSISEAVIHCCMERNYFDKEDLEQLFLMASLIDDINFYDDEEYIEADDFVDHMYEQYDFLKKSLAKEFDSNSKIAGSFNTMSLELQ